jgi:hypothetical protein
MKNKTKAVILSVTLASALLAGPLFVSVTAFGLPTQFDKAFTGELKYKVKRLQETTGKKIVVIGGSSVPFSLRCPLVDEQLPSYTTIDFGMYASLGTKVMLDLAKPYLTKDDLVVISPEQNAQTLSLYFNGKSMWEACDGDFGLVNKVSWEDRKRMIGDLPSFAGEKLSYVASGKVIDPGGIYNRDSFDAYGDIQYEDCQYNLLSGGYDRTTPIYLTQNVIAKDFVSYLNNYAKDVTGRGAKVYYRFAPMNTKAVVSGNLDSYYDYLASQLTFPILGNPHSSLLDSGWFYDTNFHLNNSGAILFTKALIQDLKLVLKDTSQTSIPDPSLPVIPPDSQTTGDVTDASSFTYSETDTEATVTGLSSEGQTKKSLTVPFSYHGKRVTSFTSGALASDTLTNLTLQSSLRFIEDDSFSKLPALKEIRILNPKPSTLAVGQGLLKGTNANLYVPSDALTDYKLNYTWSAYADRLYPLS